MIIPISYFNPNNGQNTTLIERVKELYATGATSVTITELEKLAPGDEAMQIAILNQSIQRGWQGVFPLKEDEPIHAQQKKAPEKPVSWKDGPTYLPDWAEDE